MKTAPLEIAQAQMTYFDEKNKRLLAAVQAYPDINPLETLNKVFERWERNGNSAPRMELQEVTESTTARLIGKLGDTNAADLMKLSQKLSN